MPTSKVGFGQFLVIAIVIVATVGCGGSEFEIAPVSGVVTFNDQPLAKATIRFIPQRQGDSSVVGPSSRAITDEQGQFSLKTDTGQRGAVVGPHIVSISTREARMVDPANSDEVEVVTEELIPSRYRSPSELRFNVPDSGTSDADFALKGD